MTSPAGSASSICLACGRRGPVEAHHPARHVFVDHIAAPDCPSCHRQLTLRQRDRGYLDTTATGATGLDRARALTVGVGDLFTLGLRRERAELLADTMERATAMLSVLLDIVQPADRPTRFLPDPIGARRRAKPIYARAPAHDGEPDRIFGVVWLTLDVLATAAALLGVPEPEIPEPLPGIAQRPTMLLRGWAAVEADEQLAIRLREVVARAVSRVFELFGWLLRVLSDAPAWEQDGERRPPAGPGVRAVTDLLVTLCDMLAREGDDTRVGATVAGWLTTAEKLLPG